MDSTRTPHGPVHQDSTWSPPGLHLLTSLNLAKSKVHLQSTPGGLHEESMRSGLDWRRLEKDWRWTDCGLEVDSVDEMGTGGGLHKDPWGSVRYRLKYP